MEFNYAVHVTKWFTFQPNVQYVVRPGGTGTIERGRARPADDHELLARGRHADGAAVGKAGEFVAGGGKTRRPASARQIDEGASLPAAISSGITNSP